MSRFKEQLSKAKRPVKPDDGYVRRTVLDLADKCLHSAALYFKHDGSTSHPRNRGIVFHQFVEKATLTMLAQGEQKMPGDVAKDLAQSLCDEFPGNLSAEEQDVVRVSAWRWAEATVFDPETFVGAEIPIQLHLGGEWTLTGILDRLDIRGDQAFVKDYKTSLYLPTQEAFERDFQALSYATLLAFGQLDPNSDLQFGGGLNGFHMRWEYPRLQPTDDGELTFRYHYLDRADLNDHLTVLQGAVKRLDTAYETGFWPATSGTHCTLCPARTECPIPDSEHELEQITNQAEAEAVAEQHLHLKALADRYRKSTKLWVEETGDLDVGADLVASIDTVERRKRVEPAALEEAVMASVNFGAPFDKDIWFGKTTGTRFALKRRT
jgi:hypothetical protein